MLQSRCRPVHFFVMSTIARYSGDRPAGGVGYGEVQHICKDGDSAHTELTGGKAAK